MVLKEAPFGQNIADALYEIKNVLLNNGGSTVYGFHVNSNESDPSACVTYLRDAVGMTPAKMDFTNGKFDWGSWRDAFFIPRPCMLRSDGTVAYYLNENNYALKEDGTASDISNDSFDGNAMMEWGKDHKRIWYKIVVDANDVTSYSVYIADHKEDKDYVALGINLNSNSSKFIYNVQNTYEKQSGNMMLNGIKYALENITGGTTNIATNGNPNGDFYFNNWLPTELKFQIALKIVPNLLKYKKQFDLNKYKMGLYNLENQNVNLAIPTDNGLVNMNCFDYNDAVKAILDEAKSYDQQIIEQNPPDIKIVVNEKTSYIIQDTEKRDSLRKINKDYCISQLNDLML